jgi:hypothetical protein
MFTLFKKNHLTTLLALLSLNATNSLMAEEFGYPSEYNDYSSVTDFISEDLVEESTQTPLNYLKWEPHSLLKL